MTLSDIKAAINWTSIVQFNKAESVHPETSEVSIWANGWIEESRLRISIPMELFSELVAGKPYNTLGYYADEKISKTKGLPYTQVIVFAYKAGDAGAL
jgi:hypothetical protein